MTPKEKLVAILNEAKDEQARYIYMEFKLPNHPEEEIIINPIKNADVKWDYIDATYDERLVNKHNPLVEIMGFGYFQEISQLPYARANAEKVK